MSVSEETLVSWSNGPSQTEMDKCGNAERAIRKAIDANEELSKLDISIFATGSYAVRTNVRQDSDVDVCLRYNSAWFAVYPEGTSMATFGHSDATVTFPVFKNKVGNALRQYFLDDNVTHGGKAFTIHANTYRIDTDVLPTFERRRYFQNPDRSFSYIAGVGFWTDQGLFIENYPQQTYDNGVSKNDATSRCYKRTIRILKRMRNKMQEDKIADADNIASFLIECLAWNTPVEVFHKATYTEVLRCLLIHVYGKTEKEEDCSKWAEVNGIKYLFHASQPWTREQARKFTVAVWNYIGLK